MGTIWALSLINGISSLAGTVGNVLVCFVIFRNEELQTGVNYFILSLSVADFTVCSIAQPLYIYYLNVEWTVQKFDTFKMVSYLTLHCSFSNLLSLTMNRLFAIWLPFEYGTIMREKNIIRIMSATWAFSIAMALIFTLTPLRKLAPYIHLLMLLMFVTMYTKIFVIARKQRRQIASQFASISHNYRVSKVQFEHLTTRTLAMLICASVVLFLPDLYFQFTGSDDYTRFLGAFTTMFVSSVLNPCIYVWRSEKFQIALFKTFGLLRKKHNTGSLVRNRRLKPDINVYSKENLANKLANTLQVVDVENDKP